MTSLIMANMNTLIREGYLLAGVVMAANMFIVNEVRAMKPNYEMQQPVMELNDNYPTTELNLEQQKDEYANTKYFQIPTTGLDNLNHTGKNAPSLKNVLTFVLNYRNYINFICGAVSSGVNNYFKWWNYNPGIYWNLGCYGWRSGRFIKDIFQLDINFNIGRGAGWMLLYILDPLITKLLEKGNREMVRRRQLKEKTTKKIKDFIFNCAPGFVSMPLTLHIFNFSIAISIDSIVYGMVEMVSNRWGENKKADVEGIDEGQELMEISPYGNKNENEKDETTLVKKIDN